MYSKIISGDKTTLWESHTEGQLQLVRLRGKDQFKTATGRSMYRMIFARQKLQDLAYRRVPTMGTEAPLDIIFPHPNGARVAKILNLISALYGILPLNGSSVSNPTTFPKGWAHEVLLLEGEIKKWTMLVSEGLRYRVMPACGISNEFQSNDDDIYPKAVYVFQGPQQAAAWGVLWCGRIHLLHVMLEYRATLSELEAFKTPIPSEDFIYQELQTMVDHVCNTVPFMLGEVDETGALKPSGRGQAVGAYMLIWALHVAGSVTTTPQAQKDWIASRLSHIGNAVGIQQAFVLKDFHAQKRCTGDRSPLSTERMSAWEQLR